MRYWWASQGKNYFTVIEQGTLWSHPTRNGVLVTHRTLLQDMQVGDIVFHYKKPYLRAVSVVTKEWQPSPRPAGYYDGDEGWLVRVEPLTTGLELCVERAAELVRNGPPGPLTVTGRPAQKYISPLTVEEGHLLLHETGVLLPNELEELDSLLGRPVNSWEGEDTDTPGFTKIRREQSHLRQQLLKGQHTAKCAICGKELPARLLIAGHIKPRNKCTEEERRDFDAAAMLVCALGCDPLFEWGYIVVDPQARVRRGRPAETKDLEQAVDLLIGKQCTAHNVRTAANFEVHRSLAR